MRKIITLNTILLVTLILSIPVISANEQKNNKELTIEKIKTINEIPNFWLKFVLVFFTAIGWSIIAILVGEMIP
jgi:hypothetical protein